MKPLSITIKCPVSRSNAHVHWRVQYERDEDVRTEMWAEIIGAHAMPTPHERLCLAEKPVKRIVKFTRYFGGNAKLMDFGNFVSTCKPALDALQLVLSRRKEYGQIVERKGFGFIATDTPAHVQDMYDQVKTRDAKLQGQLKIEVSG